MARGTAIRAQTPPQAVSEPAAEREDVAPPSPPKLLAAPAPQRARTEIPACIRHDMIEQAAYFRAEQRGFVPGHAMEDWLAAETEIDLLIRERYR